MIAKKLAALLLAGAVVLSPPAAVAMQGKPGGTSAAAPGDLRGFIIGRWTDDGNCANYVDFLPDGRFVTSAGAAGRWTLNGNRLTFAGTSTITAVVGRTGPDSVTLTHDDGSVGASTRCASPGAARFTMPPVPTTVAAALAMSRPATRNYLLGLWTDDGDCANVINFMADGRFTVPNGGVGRWTLAGETLTFTGQTTVTARVRSIGQGRILLLHPDGRIGQSVRC